jgi:hypothetical protein
MNDRNAILRQLFNMISPCLYGHFYWVDQGRSNEAARLPWRTRRAEDFNDKAGIRRMVLSGGRCAAGTEKRNFIEGRADDGPRIVPTRNLRSGGDSAKSDGQRRTMQRLANVANRIWGAMVLVQKAATASEIEQRQAYQCRAGLPPWRFAGVFTKTRHTIQYTLQPARLDAPANHSVVLFSNIYPSR